MTCTAERRARIQDAAEAVDAHPLVLGYDVLGPAAGPRDGWTIEITLDADACPPAVLRALSLNRMAVLDVSPRGSGVRAVAQLHGSARTLAGP